MSPQELAETLRLHALWMRREGGSRAILVGAILDGAILDGACLDGAILRRASLVGASLRSASLVGASLRSAILVGASLDGANLDGASLVGASLVGASLVGASLVGASLVGASLDGASLRRASIDGAILGGAILDGAILDGAIPRVENLDAQILARVEAVPGCLSMGSWHGEADCGTTHCRAGWAITLAGEAGAALERELGPATAGALIYHASAGYVPNFYATNEAALADLRARAAGGAR
jgi:uncharacterized protein YjbI with pentapeptide repeats